MALFLNSVLCKSSKSLCFKSRRFTINKLRCLEKKYHASIYTLDPIDPNEETFTKILVANRGEIACRIIRTCKAMGIKTVAVHSDVDFQSMHVKLADEAFCIGTALAADSYLNVERILEVIDQTGAQAVHPGYGFLSESAAFCDKLEKQGITFIGPNVGAITGMGDKLQSKRLASDAGVNIITGYDGILKNATECVQIAREIGYPVMIKASAGGGGKGMRVAWNDKEAIEGFERSRQEALNSFGDDRLLVEKYVDNPRHIEIQVLGDSHGNAIYLNERECSIQRRNQKVIEEAPSSFLDSDTRRVMGSQAVALAKYVGYNSAGTVEFLVDSKRNFYFLEMNTRLQVEHPITECITGIDLVHQMIRVAKGYKLNIQQSDVGINGWAIESRVYAEDPCKHFGLPSVGRLRKYIEPLNMPNVRCDSGIQEGSEISIYYDPMICKLVTYGATRNEAFEHQRNALDSYVIKGLKHNISLLRDIMDEERFIKGDISTNYLNYVYPDGFTGKKLTWPESQIFTCGVAAIYYKQNQLKRQITNSKRLQQACTLPKQLKLDIGVLSFTNNVTIEETAPDNFEVVTSNGQKYNLEAAFNLSEPVLLFKVNGKSHSVQLIKTGSVGMDISFMGTIFRVAVIPTRLAPLTKWLPHKLEKDLSRVVTSPMPGLVRSVAVEVGQTVYEGQEVCILEAMKMQNKMVAAIDGKVIEVNIKEGDTVEENVVLVQWQ